VASLDWIVIAVYLASMLALAWWLGRAQGSRRDYYLGGGTLPGWALAVSIIATQCSTNSLLGAPAFVGFVAGGGLRWLQYELAVPLAMLGLALLFVPVFNRHPISIYSFLEDRLGRSVRLTASACFLFFRGVATGVTVYGVASVLALITGFSYLQAVLLLMVVTITYDVLGGMRAVVISDVVQMVLLLGAVLLALLWLAPGLAEHWSLLGDRTRTIDVSWGTGGSGDYGLWPMLVGGLFLYMAYYGCDQSQAQRLLAAPDRRVLYRVLWLNGVLRFPLVLAYCLLGLGLATYALASPEFLAALPSTVSGEPNVNLVFPVFVLREFAPGLAGLAIVGLFAAAMSSIDSALNSLSASSLEDFVPHRWVREEARFFRLSKWLTLAWGIFAVAFSFGVEHIAPTILEAINKIGSMANGPLLALFVVAVIGPQVGPAAALTGFGCGLFTNLLLWVFAPGLSWLWWNPAGFAAAVGVALLVAVLRRRPVLPAPGAGGLIRPPRSISLGLPGVFVAMFTLLVALGRWNP
jgi:SSS family transporter